MKTNYESFDALYDPVWDYRSPEEAEQAQRKTEEEAESKAKEKSIAEPSSSNAGVLSMKADDGSPVILVQQVTRDAGVKTPKAIAKRAFRSVTGFVGFIVAAVIVSIIASILYNTVINGLTLDRALSTIFPFL